MPVGSLRSACAIMLWLGLGTTGVAAGASKDEPGTLDVCLELVSKSPPRVAVELRWVPQRENSQTTFALPPGWASAQDLAQAVDRVAARDDGGEALAVRRGEPGQWTVTAAPGVPVTLRYELVPHQDRIGADPSSYYHLLLFEDLFHATGSAILMYPYGADFSEPRPIRLTFRGFAEHNWELVSSYGSGPAPIELELPLERFYSAIYFGGDVRVHTRDVTGGQLVCALARDEWEFRDEEFVDLAAAVLDCERRFFEMDEPDLFLITAIPVGDRPRSSLGGTGLTNSFATFLSPGWGLAPGSEDERRIQILLAHELFHHWNGHTIRLAQPEASGYWFSEGFTDFFCRRLLWHGGLLSTEEYRDELNQAFRSFFLNPHRNAPNEEIERRFFTSRTLGDLAYQRGHLLAHWLHGAMQLHSDGLFSLDDWMLERCWESAADGVPLSCEDLLNHLSANVSVEDAATLRRVVLEGETPPISASTYADLGVLETFALAPFDLGFDSDESFERGEVVGLSLGSPAKSAGLAEGMKLKSWSVQWNRPDIPVRVQIEGPSGALRWIEYLPVGEESIDCPRLVAHDTDRERP